MTGSKFSGLRAMREQREKAQEGQEKQPQTAPIHADQTPASPAELQVGELPLEAPLAPAARRKVGRPPGKRSNPEYQSVTVLLHSATYLEVRKQLVGQPQDVSELIDSLLRGWLDNRST